MLRGIDPLLNGDLLKALRNMGHGDEIVIGDGNYSSTRDATRQPVIWLAGYSTTQIAEVVLNVLPLDETEQSAFHIVEHYSDEDREVWHEFAGLVRPWADAMGRPLPDVMGMLPREAFHLRARAAYAVIATNDPRHYACFILRKGALPEPTEQGITREAVLDEPLRDFLAGDHNSGRTINALARNQVYIVGDLIEWSESRLLSITFFGRGSLDLIKRRLASRGLALKGPESD